LCNAHEPCEPYEQLEVLRFAGVPLIANQLTNCINKTFSKRSAATRSFLAVETRAWGRREVAPADPTDPEDPEPTWSPPGLNSFCSLLASQAFVVATPSEIDKVKLSIDDGIMTCI
jgi:hypothetical protein